MESDGARGEQSVSAACNPSFVSSVFPPVMFPQALGPGAVESVPSLHSLQPVLGQPLLPSLASSAVPNEPMVLVPASALAPDLASKLFPNVYSHKSQTLERSAGTTTSVSVPTISSGTPNYGNQQYQEISTGAQQLNNLNVFNMGSEPSDTKDSLIIEKTNHVLMDPHHSQSVQKTSQTFCFSKSASEKVKEDVLSSTSGMESQSDAAPTSLKSLELSKILSSIPPGWRVVGLTNDVGNSATGTASGQMVTSTQGQVGIQALSVNKVNNMQSLPVSKDMFTEKPLNQISSSALHTISKPEDELYGPGKEVTQVDIAKVKTEIVEAWEADKDVHYGKGNRENSEDLIREKMEGDNYLSKPEFGEKALQPLSSPTGPMPVASPSLLADGQWTIVGITTLSTPFTNTTSFSNPVAQPLLSTQQGQGQMVHEKSPSRKPGSPGSTILRVPSAPIRASSPKSPGTCSKSSADLKFQDNDKTKVESNSVMKQQNIVDCKPEEMKWTIVGVTVSPSINSNSVVQSNTSFTQKESSNQFLLDKLRFLSPSTSSSDQISSHIFKPGISPMQMPNPEGLLPYNLSQSPLSAKPDPEVDSNLQPLIPDTSDENQWKIVGITSLNTPAPSPTILPLPLGTSSMGFLVPTANELVSKAVSAGSVITTTSDSFTVPVGLNLSPKIAGEVKTSCEKPTDLPAQQSLSIDELVQQHQQQNLLQALQSQLNPSVPNPKAVFEPQNQWNMVGVIANNQVSMFDQTLNPPHQNMDNVDSKSATSYLRTQDDPCVDKVEKKDMTVKPSTPNLVPKGGLSVREPCCSSGGRKPRVPKSHWTFHNYKPKKATVSNLLMLKRKKEKHGSETQWEDSVKTMKMSHWLNSLRAGGSRTKSSSERSLRSFAGNRKVFSRFGKTSSHFNEEQRSLKSGVESPTVKSKGRSETVAVGTMNGGEDSEKTMKKRCDEKGEVQSFENDVKVETQSAARKRKLKVPRKMVADMDYLPFESSSDSN